MKTAGPPSAILVSHGQPSDPDVAEAELAAFRDEVSLHLPDWSLASATLAKPGAIAKALETSGVNPLVYPVFMTDGWFTQSALPKRFGGTPVRFLRTLGVDPLLIDLAVEWLSSELDKRVWRASATKLIVVAHGSGRSRKSAQDTHAFASAIQGKIPFEELRVGFIEEPPVLVDVLGGAGRQAICLPFFAARRGHVLDDLPDALEQTEFAGLTLDPIGLHPGVPGVVAKSLEAANAIALTA